ADQLPDAGKRAWYLHANRVAACQARGLFDAGSAVVMDRSVASTLVFGAAEQGRVALEGEWPHEIPRPDLLVLLDVQEEERRRRLMGRQGQLTAEEGRLLDDEGFRARVLEGYRNLGCVVIDASGTPEEVVAQIREVVAH